MRCASALEDFLAASTSRFAASACRLSPLNSATSALTVCNLKTSNRNSNFGVISSLIPMTTSKVNPSAT